MDLRDSSRGASDERSSREASHQAHLGEVRKVPGRKCPKRFVSSVRASQSGISACWEFFTTAPRCVYQLPVTQFLLFSLRMHISPQYIAEENQNGKHRVRATPLNPFSPFRSRATQRSGGFAFAFFAGARSRAQISRDFRYAIEGAHIPITNNNLYL